MDLIRRQVAQARRRMVLQQFTATAPWCLFTTLLLAVIALAIPKIWVIKVDPQIWLWSWIGGAIGLGLLTAMVWTYVKRRDSLDAAIEIDRRFGLKERVSSALALQPEEVETEAGRALISDALQRVETIVVSEKFAVPAGWRQLLPVGTAVTAFVIALLIPNAVDTKAQAAAIAAAQQKQQIKTSAQKLQNKLEKKKEEALKNGLKDAEELFKKLTKGIDELEKDDVDQKKALVKLNDLAKELSQRKDALGDKEKMKQQFEKLKNLEKGPAEKVADALKEGNMEKALEKLNELKEKLEKGELSPEDQKQLAQQLEQMKNRMQEMVDAHKEAKQELERQIQKKKEEGDLEAVNKLQKQLDELEKADKQMSRLESMAKKFGDAEKAMKAGDSQKAAAELAKLEKDLKAMQADMKQLQSLQEMMDQLADAKDAMKCDKCDGEGCAECQGEGDQIGMGDKDSQSDQFMMSQRAQNKGRGAGERDEQETKTSGYDSKLKGNPKGGSAVKIGTAGGQNRAGMPTESIAERIESAKRLDEQSLTDQRLPRTQQDHVKEYYERLRKGE